MIKRGEVWWINFDPSLGSEIKKTRPAIVVSNNSSNAKLDRYQVAPLTSNVPDAPRPGEVILSFLGKVQTAKVNQLTTVSKERFNNKAGKIPDAAMQHIGEEIKAQLNLKRKRITKKKKS
jgi:mRNA interferase MazF